MEGFRQDAFSSAVSRGLNASERKVRSMGQLKCEWQIFMDKSKKKIIKILTALSWLGYKLKVWKSEGDETINHAYSKK